MKWKNRIRGRWEWIAPLFDLTLNERRFFLGVLLLAALGLGATLWHMSTDRAAPYPAPQTEAVP